MSTVTADSHAGDHAHDAHAGGFLSTYVFSLDHKIIGLQFLFSTLIWFLVGGLLAMGIRWQLAYPWAPMPILGNMLAGPEGGQIAPENYTMLVTMHATVMIFFVIIPMLAGAFGNFLIPLMIGAEDMAVPTLNMLSYWFMWPAFIAMGMSFFVEGGAAQGAGPPTRRSRCSSKRRREAIAANALADRADVGRHLVDDGIGQLHDHDHPDARSRHDDVSAADDNLGHVHHRHLAGLRAACAHGRRLYATVGPVAGTGFFLPEGAMANNSAMAPAAGSRCCGSICFGSTATRPCTS